MIPLFGGTGNDQPMEIVCLGCHPDDIEIGCGGTLLRLAAERPNAKIHWVVFTGCGPRIEEARKGAALFGYTTPILKSFQDGFMPYQATEVKAACEELKKAFSPDLIFTHYRGDAHQDHRLVGEMTWQTFRNHLILEYEIPKYDGDLGTPNVFVTLTEELSHRKATQVINTFPSQQQKHWFREETLLALMRLRGVECASPSGYAEAFYGRKLVL